MSENNYFLKYHELVVHRIFNKETGLYPHQREALLAMYRKAQRGELSPKKPGGREAAFMLCGVGTGKTLLQAVSAYLLAPWMGGRQILNLSDNCTLRSRFIKDFPTTEDHKPVYEQWLLYSLNILPPGVPPPKIVELDALNFNSWAFVLDRADMLVGNRQFVLNLVHRGDIAPHQVGLISIDEAHFSAASSYRTICQYFDQSIVAFFTGSKFRSDGQPLPYVKYREIEDRDELGRTIVKYAPIADYEFTIQNAWSLNPPPIKRICLYEATSSGFLILENGTETEYKLDEFIEKATTDKLWFRRIVLADSFCMPVLEMACRILKEKREATSQPHVMLVRCLNITHTHRVATLLEENFPHLVGRVGIIHSGKDGYDLSGKPSEILERFYSGELDVLCHCGSVGCGFDHKWISVSVTLTVLKSLSPAEQEWGRAIRRVPGEAPPLIHDIKHPNWAVVVTHSALELRDLFNKFYVGVESQSLKEEVVPAPKHIPKIETDYEAGETVITVNNTGNLKPGDVIKISYLKPQLNTGYKGKNEKFNLEQELLDASESSPSVLPLPSSPSGESSSENCLPSVPPSILPSGEEYKETLSSRDRDSMPLFSRSDNPGESNHEFPWAKEVEAISSKLREIRSMVSVSVAVEEILSHKQFSIQPIWEDVPAGAQIKIEREFEYSFPEFKEHIGLDWTISVEGKQISFKEYQKPSLLRERGMEVDAEGDVVINGVKLKHTLPPQAYEIFIKGLETELTTHSCLVPHCNEVARPDLDITSRASEYGSKIKRLVQGVLDNRFLIPDGKNGDSLVIEPVPCLKGAFDRVRAKGKEQTFKNNSGLLHSAVFGHIKEQTGKPWNEQETAGNYEVAIQLAKELLNRCKFELFSQKKQRSPS